MSIKLNRAVKQANVFKGNTTLSEIIKQVPEDVIAECPARIVASVMEAVNTAYHNGKASTGAEMIDTNCVWINGIDIMIDIDKINEKYIASVSPSPEELDKIREETLGKLKMLTAIADKNEAITDDEFILNQYPNGACIGSYFNVDCQIANNKGSMAIKTDDVWHYHP